MKRSLENNIKSIYLLGFFTGFMVVVPVFVPLLQGETAPIREYQVSELDSSRMIYDGRFKLHHDGQLFDVRADRDERSALAADATLIGVNQRDLVTFQVDHERAVRMAGVIPDHAVKVAESGVRGAEDARSLRSAGYDAVLVGETLVTSGDPAVAIAALVG